MVYNMYIMTMSSVICHISLGLAPSGEEEALAPLVCSFLLSAATQFLFCVRPTRPGPSLPFSLLLLLLLSALSSEPGSPTTQSCQMWNHLKTYTKLYKVGALLKELLTSWWAKKKMNKTKIQE